MDETINNSLINKLIEKIITEPLDKLTEIMNLSIRILICIIVIIVIPFITIIMVLCYFSFLIQLISDFLDITMIVISSSYPLFLCMT